MASNILPILDSDAEDIKSQLLYADALRKKSLNTDGQMIGNTFVAKNPWQNFLEGFAGSGISSYQRGRQADIEQAQRQQRQDFLAQMPQSHIEMALQPATDEQAFGPTQSPLQQTMARVDPRKYAQQMREWGSQAMLIPGMENLGASSVQQAMMAPEKEADRAAQQQARQYEILTRAQEAAKLQRERLDEQAARERERAQDRRENIILAKSLSGGGATADLDRQLKELRIKALEGKLDAPKQLPVGAQTHQRSLQNLESGLAAYEALLKSYDPQSKDVGTDAKRAAIKSAFTDLQMNMKGAYELGAITGPDMEILQNALTDPTSVWGMTRGAVGGRAPFEAQISQAKAGLSRSKRNFEQQYGVTLPEPAGQMQAPMPGATTPEGFRILGVRDK